MFTAHLTVIAFGILGLNVIYVLLSKEYAMLNTIYAVLQG